MRAEDVTDTRQLAPPLHSDGHALTSGSAFAPRACVAQACIALGGAHGGRVARQMGAQFAELDQPRIGARPARAFVPAHLDHALVGCFVRGRSFQGAISTLHWVVRWRSASNTRGVSSRPMRSVSGCRSGRLARRCQALPDCLCSEPVGYLGTVYTRLAYRRRSKISADNTGGIVLLVGHVRPVKRHLAMGRRNPQPHLSKRMCQLPQKRRICFRQKERTLICKIGGVAARSALQSG